MLPVAPEDPPDRVVERERAVDEPSTARIVSPGRMPATRAGPGDVRRDEQARLRRQDERQADARVAAGHSRGARARYSAGERYVV